MIEQYAGAQVQWEWQTWMWGEWQRIKMKYGHAKTKMDDINLHTN